MTTLDKEEKIKDIKQELITVWDRQKQTGFELLAKAYQFFVKTDDCGEMVFHKYCAHTEDMRNGDDGKADFNRFVMKRLDLTELSHNCWYPFREGLNKKVTEIANEYFYDQARRLASYIVNFTDM